jgi:hypothetical protein
MAAAGPCINVEEVDDGSDASDDSSECLKELLGGVSFTGVANDAWECPADEEGQDDRGSSPPLTRLSQVQSQQLKPFLYDITKSAAHELDRINGNAFTSFSPMAMSTRPHVQVSAIPNRGNGLVVTTDIRKGSVIYTERALLAAQQNLLSVRACQKCFCSLEPISKLISVNSSSNQQLPFANMWPVPEFSYDSQLQNDFVKTDNFGRVTCRACDSLFCTKACYREYNNLLGSCCASALIASSLHDPVLALAVKFFSYSLQLYRTTNSLEESLLHGLCGDAENVTALELGDYDTDSSTFSLRHLYKDLMAAYNMSQAESAILSLDYLHKLAAMAARNGVGLMTQSPFKPYYAAVVRSIGGRGSAQHDAIKTQVASALGSSDGSLQRGMDRAVDELVAAHISALFVLTARINHSCAPNASIQSQVFCDAHMDLVALRDIQRGEELTISYIGRGHGVGKKNTGRRRRELQSKYMFVCDCVDCTK